MKNQAEDILVAWGQWHQVHARAVGWTSADILDFDRPRFQRNKGEHSNPVLAEVIAREGSSDQFEQDADWAVRQINPDVRRVLVLRYVWGFSSREIADGMKIKERQARWRWERGKRLFMKHFQFKRRDRFYVERTSPVPHHQSIEIAAA